MTELIFCQQHEDPFCKFFPESIPPDLRINGIVLLENDECAGRIALIANPEIAYKKETVLLAGYFKCSNNQDHAQQLLHAAINQAISEGYDWLIAPVDGNTWHDYRLPLSGEQPLFTGDNAQPLYYKDLFQAAGLGVIEKYFSYRSELNQSPDDPIALQQEAANGGISLRALSKLHFPEEMQLLYPVCNRAFAANPLFAPISFEEFLSRNAALQPIIDYKHSLLAFDKAGVLLAFMICYQDKADTSGKTLVLKTIAKNPDRNIPGLMSYMGRVLYANAAAGGYQTIIHAMMHEGNASVKRSEDFGGTLLRTYGLFGKKLQI